MSNLTQQLIANLQTEINEREALIKSLRSTKHSKRKWTKARRAKFQATLKRKKVGAKK